MAIEIASTTDLLQVKAHRFNPGKYLLSGFTVFIFVALVLIPLLEALGRRVLQVGIPGASTWVQHFTLWLGLAGAILATLRGRHLSIATTGTLKSKSSLSVSKRVGSAATLGILLCLTLASIFLVKFQKDSPETIGGWFPVWLAQAAMPVAFFVMALLVLWNVSESLTGKLTILILALMFGPLLALLAPEMRHVLVTPGIITLVGLAFLGMPLYAVLGGAALLLFYSAQIPIAAVPAETYRIVTQPVLPSIPLFALAGSVLANGGSPRRLIRLVRAWTDWLPGGPAISTVAGCALFTALTGASGVTILALGGLLLPILLAAGYSKKFSLGLLTASGSVGLLFPPSLPVILYGVYGHVPIDRLFLYALVPGIFLVVILALFSIFTGKKAKKPVQAFNWTEAWQATWRAKGDLVLPVLILVGLFGGFMTLVETAAFTALWAILLETVFHRHLDVRKKLPETILEAAVLVGALLIVLGMALGLVSYLVDAQIPLKATAWVKQVIHSRLLFLLALNGMLLLVGALMDIFSAIVVVVPLIVPMGIAFGVDTIHLGIIFLANLELGYLTPPVGMNLFLSSLRFNQPLIKIWQTVLPFLIIFAIWVLFITYVPLIFYF